MDSNDVSSGVRLFWSWLNEKGIYKNLTGIEMGCGKGRNCIWLAQQDKVKMVGVDFSSAAIQEAKNRADKLAVIQRINFIEHDVTFIWPFPDNHFDFAIDCFASTDIESYQGRADARDELKRVLKFGGYLLVYTLSTEDEFHREMIQKSPAHEKNSFVHPSTGKFEKVFAREELLELYQPFNLVAEKRINKKTIFFGKEYDCCHFWMVFQKLDK